MSTNTTETLRGIAQLAYNRHGYGGRQIGRVAESAGFTLAYTTFDKILKGTYSSRPQAKTLEALAFLADVPLSRVYAAAGEPYTSDKFADELPPDIDQLTSDQRNSLITVARAFLKANREIEGLHNELEDQQAEPQEQGGNVTHADFAGEDAGPEQKIPELDELAAHPPMTLSRDTEDDYFDQAGEEGQDPGDNR